jgi:hypothetical protein
LISERLGRRVRERIATDDEVVRHERIVATISEPLRLIEPIAGVIEENGGWPEHSVWSLQFGKLAARREDAESRVQGDDLACERTHMGLAFPTRPLQLDIAGG